MPHMIVAFLFFIFLFFALGFLRGSVESQVVSLAMGLYWGIISINLSHGDSSFCTRQLLYWVNLFKNCELHNTSCKILHIYLTLICCFWSCQICTMKMPLALAILISFVSVFICVDYRASTNLTQCILLNWNGNVGKCRHINHILGRTVNISPLLIFVKEF